MLDLQPQQQIFERTRKEADFQAILNPDLPKIQVKTLLKHLDALLPSTQSQK